MSIRHRLPWGASLAWLLALGTSLPMGACLPSARSTVQPPVVENVRIFDGKLGTAADMGVAAQAAAAVGTGSSRGLTHGNVSGVWRIGYPNPDGKGLRVQELWRLTDDGQTVRGTRRYDPDFDPALASTKERSVAGTWGLGGQGVWAVGLLDGMGSLVLLGEKSISHYSALTGTIPAQGVWVARFDSPSPGPSSPPPALSPAGQPSPGGTSPSPSPSPTSSPSPSPSPSLSPSLEPAASEAVATS